MSRAARPASDRAHILIWGSRSPLGRPVCDAFPRAALEHSHLRRTPGALLAEGVFDVTPIDAYVRRRAAGDAVDAAAARAVPRGAARARAARLRAPPELLALAGRPRQYAHARADAVPVVLVRGVHRGDQGPDAEPVLAAERLARAADATPPGQAPALLNPWPQGSTTIDIRHIYSNSVPGEGARDLFFHPTYIVEILCSFCVVRRRRCWAASALRPDRLDGKGGGCDDVDASSGEL